jgi:hypothetical protein
MLRKRHVAFTAKEFAALLICLAGQLVSGPGVAGAAPPFDYMAALRQTEADVVAAGDDASRRRPALQMLATQQSMVGDTERAIESFHLAMRRGTRTPLGLAGADVDAFLAGHEVQEALATIVEEARGRQVVMINEAHHVPRDRAFAQRVALELRKLGFKYLAMETLGPKLPAMVARGYPSTDEYEGYYTREPVFGDFARQALSAGYQLVNYEYSPPDEVPGEQRIDAREEGQAQNLVERIFAKDPGARVLIHVGYGHLDKGSTDRGEGKTSAMMAERLRTKLRIEPFCIDQSKNDPANAVVDAILAKYEFESYVLKAVGAANPYSETATVDMYVYHRPVRLVLGRPHWLAMAGYRAPHRIPATLLPKQGRRLIQAFVASESADAVPMDQVLVTAGQPVPALMLPKGKYRFAFQE